MNKKLKATFIVTACLVWIQGCVSAGQAPATAAFQRTAAAAVLFTPTDASTATSIPSAAALTQAAALPETESRVQASPAPATLALAPSTEETSGGKMDEGEDTALPQTGAGSLAQNTRGARRDVTYCTVNGVELKMDYFLPKSQPGKVPLVLLVHGGGWSEGDKRGGAGVIDGPSLLAAGFAFASVNYRLAAQAQFPAMIEDVKCAIRFLRANAREYQLDSENIGVYGPSAGGHLVNLVGTTDASAGFEVGEYLEQSSRVQAVVDLLSGPGCRSSWW